MNVLGISGSARDAAVAISVDGAIVAAAAEESFARVPGIGYRDTGGYPLAAINACLVRAGIACDGLDRVMVVADGPSAMVDFSGTMGEDARHVASAAGCENVERELRARPHQPIAPAIADARQLDAVSRDDRMMVLVLSPRRGESGVFVRRGAALSAVAMWPGLEHLSCAIRRMTDALGFAAESSYRALEHLASFSSGSEGSQFATVMGWDAQAGFVFHEQGFAQVVAPLRVESGSPAADGFLNVRADQERRTLAAAFCSAFNRSVVEMLAHLANTFGAQRVGLAGALASSPGLLDAIGRHLPGRVVVAPVPESVGRAIGAAIDGSGIEGATLQTLALGPEYSESEIKHALENCRLDYLYEPDWTRLTARISRMLSRGTIFAWFQGPAGFGPRSIGTRSVLADPSNRYARENVNRFLRQGAIDEALPVSMTSSAIGESLAGAAASPFLTINTLVPEPWRDRLRAALDGRQAIPLQMASEEQSPALFSLLNAHQARSGVPGLINIPLSGAGETAACAPRDAIRTMYSAAIDALVIGRFLLMKDYWLLRSGADA
jgi:carbamoyltransferase